MGTNSKTQWTASNALTAMLVVGGAAAVFMIAAASCEPSTADPANDTALQRVDAERYCKAEVEARLKSPASAEYSDVTVTGFDAITVRGNVDSQNSFGAMLRSPFSCTAQLVGQAWALKSIDVG